LAKVQLLAAATITGCHKGAGLAALEFDSYLLPTDLRLLKRSLKVTAKLLSSSPSHPLSRFVSSSRAKKPPKLLAPLDKTLHHSPALLAINMETISHSPIPPWVDPSPKNMLIAIDKAAAEKEHARLLEFSSPTELFLYTDGSLRNKNAGAGLAFRLLLPTAANDSDSDSDYSWGRSFSRLGPHQSVYSSELEGIRLALSSVGKILTSLDIQITKVVLFSDNQACISHSCNPTRASGQQQRLENRRLLDNLATQHPTIPLFFVWIPGHREEIKGSVLADEMARHATRDVKEKLDEAAQLLETLETIAFPSLASLSAVQAALTEEIKVEWSRRWRDEKAGRLLKLVDTRHPSNHTTRLHATLSRRHTSIISQLRNSRSPLNAHRFKFKLVDSNRCRCTAIESTQHFLLDCPLYTQQRLDLVQRLGPDVVPDVSLLLSDFRYVRDTAIFINETGRFPDYYHRVPRLETLSL